MNIEQLSIFLENKTGRINQMCKVLSDASINMHAFSLAEGAEFGIMRIIVSDIEKAKAILKENNFTCRSTQVVCVDMSNESGSLGAILDLLAAKDIFIDYMYAFSQNDFAKVILRTSDIDATIKTLQENGIKLISTADFK